MQKTPDAIVEVRFMTHEEGGRTEPVDPAHFSAVFEIDRAYHSGRFLPFLSGGEFMELGRSYEVPVVFVFPELVLHKIFAGKILPIWDGRVVATGKVIRVCGSP